MILLVYYGGSPNVLCLSINYRYSMIDRMKFTRSTFDCGTGELKLNDLMDLQFASLEKPLDRSEFWRNIKLISHY